MQILTEFDSHQYPSYPNRIGIENHPDYLNQLMTMDSPLMVSVYHRSHAKPTKQKLKQKDIKIFIIAILSLVEKIMFGELYLTT